jgi:mannose-6-phosphate isomerase-like protein (cupin superfamily)
MADINEYINSGNLEQYCLEMFNPALSQHVTGLSSANPEVKKELNEIEVAIEQLAQSHAVEPGTALKNRVLAALDFFDSEKIDLDHLPPTSKYSNYTRWFNAVEHLLPSEPFEDFFMHELQRDEHIAQMLVVTKLDVAEEMHEEIGESFFILKGQCECTVGDEVITLNAGDHLEIPLHVNHDIKILSPYVIAILQHQFA